MLKLWIIILEISYVSAIINHSDKWQVVSLTHSIIIVIMGWSYLYSTWKMKTRKTDQLKIDMIMFLHQINYWTLYIMMLFQPLRWPSLLIPKVKLDSYIPVPNSGSTTSSQMIGSLRLQNGCRANLPWRCWNEKVKFILHKLNFDSNKY